MKQSINQHIVKFWFTLKDIVAAPARAIKRFRKRRAQQRLHRPIKMELQPGANRIQFVRDGRIVADMVLVNITFHYKGETQVEFREHTSFMKERTMHPKYFGYTIAEIEGMLGNDL